MPVGFRPALSVPALMACRWLEARHWSHPDAAWEAKLQPILCQVDHVRQSPSRQGVSCVFPPPRDVVADELEIRAWW